MSAKRNLDTRGVGKVVTWAFAGGVLVGFVRGAPALAALDALTVGPVLSWATPVMVDVLMVVFAVGAAVARQRRDGGAWFLWLGTAALAALSTYAQLAHTLAHTTAAGWEHGAAVALGTAPPLLVLASTEAWLRIVVSGPAP